MIIDTSLAPAALASRIDNAFQIASGKCLSLDRSWSVDRGTPVFTESGEYTTRGWTEWTQGFQYGCMLLAGEGVGDSQLIELAQTKIASHMLPHVTHIGVHDHGFNNLSTYGNLLRLMHEGTLPENEWQRRTYAQAIAVSGAVQAARWSRTACGLGYVYSFNGPHSLFIDTMRTIRILVASHQLGHCLMGENDERIDLLSRSVEHSKATAKYIVFDGASGHTFDVRGRTAHEGVFNRNDGRFRSRATQQGYSPFSTWTRGLAWAMLGYAEQLEWLDSIGEEAFAASTGQTKQEVAELYLRAARDTCEHYIEDAAARDGIVYWDDGAPNLHHLGDWRAEPAQPFNAFEPVDASASAIAAQGLIRLGIYLAGSQTVADKDASSAAARYQQAGLTVARTLLTEPYLATDPNHQGLLLHSVYHWPNGWDYVPPGSRIPFGESSMWGDYHLLELALLIRRMADGGEYPTFFSWGDTTLSP